MNRESLSNADWSRTVDRLGGSKLLENEARETGAFERARKVKCAVDQLRLVLAYCWGWRGLRLTAAWAEAIGLASDEFAEVILGKLVPCSIHGATGCQGSR